MLPEIKNDARTRMNNSIRRVTSFCGRFQFSLEKANTVSSLTPILPLWATILRRAFRPAWWPNVRGRFFLSAQRPLPSITIATWAGMSVVLLMPRIPSRVRFREVLFPSQRQSRQPCLPRGLSRPGYLSRPCALHLPKCLCLSEVP